MSRGALGIVETRGLTNTIFLIDRMIKSADVKLIWYDHIGSGVIVALIWGDLASVKHAVEIGSDEAKNESVDISFCVLPKISDQILNFLIKDGCPISKVNCVL